MRLGRPDKAQVHRTEYARLKELDMVEFDRAHGYGTQQERQSPAKLGPLMAGFHLTAGQYYARAGNRAQSRRPLAARLGTGAGSPRTPSAFGVTSFRSTTPVNECDRWPWAKTVHKESS